MRVHRYIIALCSCSSGRGLVWATGEPGDVSSGKRGVGTPSPSLKVGSRRSGGLVGVWGGAGEVPSPRQNWVIRRING